MGGTDACPLVAGADSCPFCVWDFLYVWDWRCLCGWGSLGTMFSDGLGCDPNWIVIWTGASQCWCVEPDFQKKKKKYMLMNIPKSFASNALPHNKPHSSPIFLGGPPWTAVRSESDSYGDSVFLWDPVHVNVCMHLLRMGSLFPPVPWSSFTQEPWPSMPDAPGALSPNARSPGMENWNEAQNSVGESL